MSWLNHQWCHVCWPSLDKKNISSPEVEGSLTRKIVSRITTPEFHSACMKMGVLKVRVCAYASPKTIPASNSKGQFQNQLKQDCITIIKTLTSPLTHHKNIKSHRSCNIFKKYTLHNTNHCCLTFV